jgi:hypothetical protein
MQSTKHPHKFSEIAHMSQWTNGPRSIERAGQLSQINELFILIFIFPQNLD